MSLSYSGSASKTVQHFMSEYKAFFLEEKCCCSRLCSCKRFVYHARDPQLESWLGNGYLYDFFTVVNYYLRTSFSLPRDYHFIVGVLIIENSLCLSNIAKNIETKPRNINIVIQVFFINETVKIQIRSFTNLYIYKYR